MFLKNDYEFNILDIYNYNKKDKLYEYYKFIEKNHNKLSGDIVEIGVYKGASLIAAAFLLKELGSKKTVWGFDSFSGFPSYHEFDNLNQFESLYESGQISKDHYECYLKNINLKEFMNKQEASPANISSSGDFSNTSKNLLKRKIDFLGLDNIKLVDGSFRETMKKNAFNNVNFMAVLMDCDLYESHKIALPFVWDRIVLNGYMFLDEYYSLKFPGARIAINNFFLDKKDKPEMYPKLTMDFERWYINKNCL
jgi:hypothetical protein